MTRKKSHRHTEQTGHRSDPAADPLETPEAGPGSGTDGRTAEPAHDEESSGENGRSSEVEEKERELASFRDRHLRLAAEYDNFRKRTERERSEAWTRAQAQLVERLLDGLDDLQRVTSLDADQSTAGAILEGVQLVERKLVRALEGAGLERLEPQDEPFDPEVHEALVSSPTSERDADDTVAEVFQPGFLFKGVLLRPARVRVHKFDG